MYPTVSEEQQEERERITSKPKPHGSKVILIKEPQSILVVQPPVGWNYSIRLFLIISSIWTLISASISIEGALLSEGSGISLFLIQGLSFTAIGMGYIIFIIRYAHLRNVLCVGPSTYTVFRKFYWKNKHVPTSCQELHPQQVVGESQGLTLAELSETTLLINRVSHRYPCILIKEGEKETDFGRGLSEPELDWILDHVNEVICRVTCQR